MLAYSRVGGGIVVSPATNGESPIVSALSQLAAQGAVGGHGGSIAPGERDRIADWLLAQVSENIPFCEDSTPSRPSGYYYGNNRYSLWVYLLLCGVTGSAEFSFTDYSE